MSSINNSVRPVILIDNYDSFTYNLVQYFGELGVSGNMLVLRNDELSVAQVMQLDPLALIFSPGPCTPVEAGISLDLITKAIGIVPMFGVCLGMQSIVQALGGKICHAPTLMHGKKSFVRHDGRGIFQDIPEIIEMGRYHSLIADPQSIPSSIEVSGRCVDAPQEIMAIRACLHPVIEAVQFHPESILSQYGHTILANFLELAIKDTIFNTKLVKKLDANILPA